MHSVKSKPTLPIMLGKTIVGDGIFENMYFVPIMEASCEKSEFDSRIASLDNSDTVKRYILANPFFINSNLPDIRNYLWAEVELK
jgi:flagellar assembly factor FliW